MYIADKGRAFKEKEWESGIITLSYRMLDLWEDTELKMSAEEYENADCDIILDALFGIGLGREVTGASRNKLNIQKR